MSTLSFNTWNNLDGSENYKCRSWVNFNGTGTVAIRASGNVTSITDNGVGDYTVNFTTPIVDANYSFTGMVRNDPAAGTNANAQVVSSTVSAPTASNIRITTGTPSNGAASDYSVICISVFR